MIALVVASERAIAQTGPFAGVGVVGLSPFNGDELLTEPVVEESWKGSPERVTVP